MYERVLVATDGSVSAERAGDHAIELAENFGAELHALYVVDDRVDIDYVSGRGSEWDQSAVREEGERATRAIAERATERGVDAVTAVESGIPYEEIIDYVEGNGVDLVVVGAHGTTGADSHLLLGSVSEKVIRASEVPIHVVKMTDVAVADVGEATDRARERLREEGHESASIVDTERSGTTWYVRVRTGDDTKAVAVDVESGETTLEPA